MWKVINWELGKRVKFDYITKCYIHQVKTVLENETHEILWDFLGYKRNTQYCPEDQP